MDFKNHTVGKDPFQEFEKWLSHVTSLGEIEPLAMTLCTVSNNIPHARIVLFKGISQQGFCFFTNYESDKAKEIETNENVALVFHWKTTNLQIRIEGRVEKLTRQESENYFSSRPRGSQISAWTSQQSRPVSRRQDLLDRWKEIEKKFDGQVVPCPPFWGGYRVLPQKIEFWISREDRLHDRYLFTKRYSEWVISRLSP